MGNHGQKSQTRESLDILFITWHDCSVSPGTYLDEVPLVGCGQENHVAG
jgi:hypothetical protein